MFRKTTSLSIALIFIVLAGTGVLSFFQDYSRPIATLHTIFGIIFIFGVTFHLLNNFRPFKSYTKGRIWIIIFSIGTLIFIGAFLEKDPFKTLMDFGAKVKAKNSKALSQSLYEVIEMNTRKDIRLTIDLLRSTYYWHPQMAVWLEDADGRFLETLFVSNASARGLFYGGRNKENFKQFDAEKDAEGELRRVNALPVWSHTRGIHYEDGLYMPTNKNPLPDAITGATIKDNFKLISSVDEINKFNLRLELNVAFDDNEFYSEFDFPDDEIFHNGTGQLGQPSIVFEAQIDMNDSQNYYLMQLIGHGHHSGQNGEVYKDLSTLTTALELVERIVVGVKKE